LYERVDARFDALHDQIAALWRRVARPGDDPVA
jgi:hypothetical protein